MRLATHTFGLEKTEFSALLEAASRKKFSPSPEKVAAIMIRFQNLTHEEAITALTLLNSPARNSFTAYDVLGYCEKHKKFKSQKPQKLKN
jgi:hypothetical protein